MIAQNIFKTCYSDFISERRLVLSTLKNKRRKVIIINLLRGYRTKHLLEGIVKTLLLWRCLIDFNLTQISRNVERRVSRSFYFLLQSTTPQDVEILEYLLKELNSSSFLFALLELRILELLICSHKTTLPLLKSTHYQVQSIDALEKQWKRLSEYVHGSFGIKITDKTLAQARPV